MAPTGQGTCGHGAVALHFLLLGLLLPLATARGGPDGPSQYAPPLAVFGGDQSAGVRSGVDFLCPAITVLRIEDLTADIAPAPPLAGLLMSHTAVNGSNGADAYGWSVGGGGGNGGAGVPLSLTFMPGEYGITTAGDVAEGTRSHGIVLESTGGNAGSGGDGWGLTLTPAFGGDGGRGGQGGDLTVAADGDITTAGKYAAGVLAASYGGRGGNGGGAYNGIYVEGGDGGAGGNGGAITIETSGTITTTGDAAPGIAAHSGGGISGRGGDGGGFFGGAGPGGDSGRGGNLAVTNAGEITTTGDDAYGLLLTSVGGYARGGGGGGGIYFYGGSGESSGDGGTAWAVNRGTITTTGRGASAILSQSIGGGGGSGGSTGGLSALGGDGAAGGHGGSVSTENYGALFTHGDAACGVLAQSIGGGGGVGAGAGGFVITGGSGSAGGEGGRVCVTNAGTIVTAGHNAEAIYAESIGGGGGRAESSGGSVAIGGSGGGSGGGNQAIIYNTGRLRTAGHYAPAIVARSVGGGGGRGGGTQNGMAENAAAGGDVEIHNGMDRHLMAVITTSGDYAPGMFGQSVGGGGGSGGRAGSAAAGVAISAGIAIGGKGGGGGDAYGVSIRNSDRVVTAGAYAPALWAQVVGGGGGNGGDAIALNTAVGVPNIPAVAMTVAVGGSGGDGGNGWASQITNTADILTRGFSAAGAVAQSIGGGGGAGGNALTGNIVAGTSSASVALGGSGGGGGNGGMALITNDAVVRTGGAYAYGLHAQSIGGGGGTGGDSAAYTIEVPFLIDLIGEVILPSPSLNLSIGGLGGVGGSGGAVTVTSDGAVATAGAHAHAILAQSIGGGGGAGGNAYQAEYSVLTNPAEMILAVFGGNFELDMGGTGGTGGHGAAVTVTNTADVDTQGHFAHGILAQSVGGGGGTGGIHVEDGWGLFNPLSVATTLHYRHGGSGNGGTVDVINDANLTTRGGFAHGILAQSVGGGGGAAAITHTLGNATLDSSTGASGLELPDIYGIGVGFIGSSGGAGTADDVTVTHRGRIETFGPAAYGILAQSACASWWQNAGPITVTVDGDVIAHGLDAHGVVTQTTGGITLTIDSGTVQGGSGNAAGLWIDGGATLVNRGTIRALSGTAIRASEGHQTIDNEGVIAGDVLLGAGSHVMTNHDGAVFAPGRAVDLGASGLLTNGGLLSPGGPGAASTIALTGSLALTATGILDIDVLGTEWGAFDCIDLTGTLHGASADLEPEGLVRFAVAHDLGLTPTQAVALAFLRQAIPGATPLTAYDFTACSDRFQYDVVQDGLGTICLEIYYPGRPGDADDDGDVDLDDFSAFKRGFGTGSTWAQGDFDGNGKVDLDDFLILKANFNATAVPEPATAALLGVGAMVLLRRRGHPRRSVAALAVALLAAMPVWAAPDPPAEVTPPLAIFRADQSAGIRSGVDFQCPQITDVRIEQLTADITPAPFLPGALLKWTADDGAPGVNGPIRGEAGGIGGTADLRVVFADEDRAVTTGAADPAVTPPPAGIVVEAGGGRGGRGGNGEDYDFGIGGYGGQGGQGGWGGSVVLVSDAAVTTIADGAAGLLAVGRGGTGGQGGDGTGRYHTHRGPGGDGGVGGNVHVTHSGTVVTWGAAAHAVDARSLGGHGGLEGLLGTYRSPGGNGGDGGQARVDNTGALRTAGHGAAGVHVEACGGVREIGGSATYPSADGDGGQVVIDNRGPVTTRAGGAAGLWARSAGRTGRRVAVVSNAPVDTYGAFSHGIVAQSVGGPAGAVEDGAMLTLGGDDGHADDVVVTTTCDIVTCGDFACGVLAQSVGGGGGVLGVAVNDTPAAAMQVRLSNTATGFGGVVTVDNAGAITTGGTFAHAILAQSVGGGGGFAAISESAGDSTLDAGPDAAGVTLSAAGAGTAFAGSCGGWGFAWEVRVNHTGTIDASGRAAHGILAQSAAGTPSYCIAGPVSVDVDGDVIAHGEDACGIVARSVGGQGDADGVRVTIAGGNVQGGTGCGAGVALSSGAANTLTNRGTVAALSGMAVLGGPGDNRIVNEATLVGSVLLDDGANTLVNHPGGTFASGDVVQLGSLGVLTNSGTLSPAGTGAVGRTELTGDVELLDGGVLTIDVADPSADGCDHLVVSGAVTGGTGVSGPLPIGGILRFVFPPAFDGWTLAPGATVRLTCIEAGALADVDLAITCEVIGCPAWLTWEVTRADNAVRLELTNTRLAGDADEDGDVDLDDFLALKQGFGTAGGWANGDFNGDAKIDLDDLVILKQNFGAVRPADGRKP